MELLLALITHGIALAIGVVVGVHNSNSSTVAPIARATQEIGRKAVKAVKAPKKK